MNQGRPTGTARTAESVGGPHVSASLVRKQRIDALHLGSRQCAHMRFVRSGYLVHIAEHSNFAPLHP